MVFMINLFNITLQQISTIFPHVSSILWEPELLKQLRVVFIKCGEAENNHIYLSSDVYSMFDG